MKATLLCNSIIISPTPLSTSSSSRFSPLIIKPNRFSSRSLLTGPVEGETTEETTPNSVSRRLILLRHAESSWDDRTLRDHERPLSKAGRVDAISVSRKLQQLGWIPELILSSDAARTRETLKIMQEQVQGFLEAEVHLFSSFYSIAAMDGQTAEHIQKAVCEYSRDEILTVILLFWMSLYHWILFFTLDIPNITHTKEQDMGNWAVTVIQSC
ncbi:uncharacterized protein At3g52155, chloroplastic isoform X2 [Macadamia integrifolia]|uniref:uncharacterized protein At3g52155, chloroplastic isoform X2 n=1 Tax=Macadamia integrifolia TaxID=60698 RepID=UPI001C52D43F|nr:uncharacterized protein At3g52155, chloroplastic isoform X2 [Macadamia integrifolia]